MIAKIKQILIDTARRIFSYWYQIGQYMLLVFIWAGFTQLHQFAYPIGSPRSPVPNGLFCIVCLLLSLGLPALCYRYLTIKYFKLDYR